ncbi:MAG TPA: cytochrome C [Candidatus Dormibacteraeota bacterium]|nr:cytochrome C [Candidatus Dormibacteraeota bacterium]
MKATHRFAFCLLAILAVGFGASRLSSKERPAPPPQKAKKAAPAATANQSQVDRGKYLVENVGMCEECHTPRYSNGDLDESRRLQGAAIWIVPVHNMTNWAMRAPALAGLPGFTDAEAETVLEQGIGPNGLPIQPPMHIYHMNAADAQAIVSYLRSLPDTYPRN